MLSLINDTLDLQKIETGKMKLEYQVVNCKEFIEELIDMVKPNASLKEIKLDIRFSNITEATYAKMDVVRLKQIFVNIMSNAIKFTPNGGTICFSYDCIRTEKGINYDKFVIEDSGIGMSKEFIDNGLFKPYEQEHNSMTTKYAGTGLGLAITKRLVELMGGRIEVHSEVGAGTAFTIYLNFEMIDENEAKKLIENDRKELDVHSDILNGKRVLLCEDHPLNAEISRRLLEKSGCIVEWAENGSAGVDKLIQSEEGYYNLILMDIRMPIMDGYTATRKIRSLDRNDVKTMPIIAMTANAYEEDIRESKAAGMNAHLSKPIEPQKLYEIMAQFLE